MLKYASLEKKKSLLSLKEINTAEFQTTQRVLFSNHYLLLSQVNSFYTTFQRTERSSDIELFRNSIELEKFSSISLP
jgi:hypothetical protein